MKYSLLTLLMCVCCLPPEPQWTTTGTVVKVIDGDTVDIEVKRVIRVRLLDCWAPESKIDSRISPEKQQVEKAAGLRSKQYLATLALNKPVILSVPTDPSGDLMKSTTMGRVLGRVWLPGDTKSLSEHQVGSGNATIAKRDGLK